MRCTECHLRADSTIIHTLHLTLNKIDIAVTKRLTDQYNTFVCHYSTKSRHLYHYKSIHLRSSGMVQIVSHQRSRSNTSQSGCCGSPASTNRCFSTFKRAVVVLHHATGQSGQQVTSQWNVSCSAACGSSQYCKHAQHVVHSVKS